MITRRALAGLIALLATRCSSSPPPPAMLTLTVIGGPDQNPDASGHPAPVAVRLFQLNGIAKFERADFFALTEREQQTLDGDSQGSEEFVVTTGETRTISRELKKGVQFVGMTAAFYEIDRSRWRAEAPVAASGPSKLTLKINGTNATLS